MNNFRKDDVVKKQAAADAEDEQRAKGFDNVYEMDDETQDRSQYCPKCLYESRHCKHREIRKDNKGEQAAIITSSQALGWREPYDNFTFGNNRSGMCERTFKDTGHL